MCSLSTYEHGRVAYTKLPNSTDTVVATGCEWALGIKVCSDIEAYATIYLEVGYIPHIRYTT